MINFGKSGGSGSGRDGGGSGSGWKIGASTSLSVRRVYKTDYCVTFMHSSWLPAISLRIEKTSNENYV